MFGRFPLFGGCRRCVAPAQAYILTMPPRALARWLPQLGGVLYLPAHGPGGAVHAAGLLVEQADLAPLHRSQRLHAVSLVTPDGPREWADVIDANSHICARIYLLPGTDYCAWDAMLRTAVGHRGGAAARPAFRASGARLARFRQRRLAGLDVLDLSPCATNRLDLRVAGEIVRDEAVVLPVP
ncbi:hypothetical protein [Frateuria sp. STR12]|uniref:hypothetical protein n=1 Tax=Frateuria hangzhouensis TaxID=2995589 RepID=UPI0022608AE7|nr:hypothetical protein [Frateuria sp. STR12]MCX7513682.1 hypothetical protein [Frateuria sp. STR12]